MTDLATMLQEWVPEWVDDAVCGQVDGDLFFPEGRGGSVQAVKMLCDGDPNHNRPACPVREMCLEYAVSNHINHGIWGGTSPRTRVAIRKARGIAELEEDYDD